MNYLLKNRRTRAPRRKQFFISFIFFAVIISLFFIFPSFFSYTLSSVAGVVWNAEQVILGQSQGLVAFFSSRAQLTAENQSLKDALNNFSSERLVNNVLRAENARLREMLSRPPKGKSLLASVLVRPPRTPFDILIIDAGVEDGVKQGSIVTSEEILLGKVVLVSDHTSQVLLFSTAKESIDGIISRTGESVSLIGSGGGNFSIVLPRSFDIVSGDIVVSPVTDTLIIGEVVHIDSDPSSSFQVALLKTPVNMHSLRWVMVSPSFNEE